jgi:hypothetical protein
MPEAKGIDEVKRIAALTGLKEKLRCKKGGN